MFNRINIRSDEFGFDFLDGEFKGLLAPGKYWILRRKRKVAVVSARYPWIESDKLDMIVKSGVLEGKAVVLDLRDYERALVWIDRRFARILGPGLYALWTTVRNVRTEIVDARQVRFESDELATILRSAANSMYLMNTVVPEGHVGMLIQNGEIKDSLAPGKYAFWRDICDLKVELVDLREKVAVVQTQDIMTSDKVTLRMNALAAYRVIDPKRSIIATEKVADALYREVQLALRSIVGSRDVDVFLADKDQVSRELDDAVRKRAAEWGLEIVSIGIRDITLPGDMRELMNKVVEAKKAAEANLISRREETAAMRSQVNTAKLLEDNPTLMRLRELEILEKLATNSKLNVVLGEKGLSERITNLL